MSFKHYSLIAVFLIIHGFANAGTTPMETPVPDEKITTIECEYQLDEKDMKRFDVMPAKGTYHYKVYLPPGYNSDKDTAYPCIFVASPSGNAPMTNLAEKSKKDKFIVIMLAESKNGPIEPNMGNFLAAHDDAVKRFRIQEGLKIATGLSGGARGSSTNAGMRPGFCGIILQAAGFVQYQTGAQKGHYDTTSLEKYKDLAVYAVFGKNDNNKSELPNLKKEFPSYTEFETESFDGGHEWAPAECMNNGIDWLFNKVLTAESIKKNKPLAIQIVRRKLGSVQNSTSDIEKFELLSSIDSIEKIHKLSTEPDLKDKLADLQKQLQELRTSKAVLLELDAQKAFNALASTESKKREKSVKDKTSEELSSLMDSYKKLAEKYKGTKYGKKAEDKAKGLESEISPQKK
jgi:hypothetical protein